MHDRQGEFRGERAEGEPARAARGPAEGQARHLEGRVSEARHAVLDHGAGRDGGSGDDLVSWFDVRGSRCARTPQVPRDSAWGYLMRAGALLAPAIIEDRRRGKGDGADAANPRPS